MTDMRERTGKGRHANMVGLNIVPMIGVILAVMAVFVIVAPTTRLFVPLEFPGHGDSRDSAVFVSIRDTGEIYVERPIGNNTVRANWNTYDSAIDRLTGGDRERKIFVRADPGVSYADVLRLMDRLRARGYRNTALVTEDVVD